MDKCSPVEMRKALQIVEVFRKTGVRFVPMPVLDDSEHAEAVSKMQEKLSVFIDEADEKAKEFTDKQISEI